MAELLLGMWPLPPHPPPRALFCVAVLGIAQPEHVLFRPPPSPRAYDRVHVLLSMPGCRVQGRSRSIPFSISLFARCVAFRRKSRAAFAPSTNSKRFVLALLWLVAEGHIMETWRLA